MADIKDTSGLHLEKQAIEGHPIAPTGGVNVNVNADPMLVGITEAMVKAHPELAQVRALYVAGDYAGAINALYNTTFYQSVGANRFANEEFKVSQPGAYEAQIKDQWVPALKQYAIQHGLAVTDAGLTAIAKTAFDKGLNVNSPATLELFAGTDSTGKSYVTGLVGGQAISYRDNLNQLAANMGVKYDTTAAARSIALGQSTEQQWQDDIKNLAKGSFPAWQKQIDAGLTVKQIAQPYTNSVSTILGLDPAAVGLDDKLVKQGMQGLDPANPSAMPLYQFEQQVRKDPRWATSKDAMDSLSSTGYQIAKEWGLMS